MSQPTERAAQSSSKVEEDTVYEEQLVTDDEDDLVSDVEEVEEEVEEAAGSPASKAPEPARPRNASGGVVGKVKVSEPVKSMKMRSPTSQATRLEDYGILYGSLPMTSEHVGKLSIIVPVLGGSKTETTNELTRRTRPENRYWKAPVSFSAGGRTSPTLTLKNVHIPFHQNDKYGVDFIYMSLPSVLADAFAEAGKKRRPTVVTEKSLISDPVRWWKIANKVEDKFGVAKRESKGFMPVPLATVFASTQKGIKCNAELKFFVKAATEEGANITATTPQTVAVEVVRGYIIETDVDVQPPSRIQRTQEKVVPRFSDNDFASDDLMKRLANLGI